MPFLFGTIRIQLDSLINLLIFLFSSIAINHEII